MWIKSKKVGLRIRHFNPTFEVTFGEQAVEVPEEWGKIILRNPMFEKSKPEKKKEKKKKEVKSKPENTESSFGKVYKKEELSEMNDKDIGTLAKNLGIEETDKDKIISDILKRQEKL